MTTQLLQPPPLISEVDVTSPAFQNALARVGGFLAEMGLTDVIAVSALHRHFPLSDGEILLEETNEAARTQTIRVVPCDSGSDAQASTWRFGPQGQRITMVRCVSGGGTSVH